MNSITKQQILNFITKNFNSDNYIVTLSDGYEYYPEDCNMSTIGSLFANNNKPKIYTDGGKELTSELTNNQSYYFTFDNVKGFDTLAIGFCYIAQKQ